MSKPNKFTSPFGKPGAPVPDPDARVTPRPRFWERPHSGGWSIWFDELKELDVPTIPKIVEALAERQEKLRAADASRHARRLAQRQMERSYGSAW